MLSSLNLQRKFSFIFPMKNQDVLASQLLLQVFQRLNNKIKIKGRCKPSFNFGWDLAVRAIHGATSALFIKLNYSSLAAGHRHRNAASGG
jgi:hypothetical protein